MKKIYNIALFSAVPATATNNEQFFFDWGQIEDVPYKVRFTLQSVGSAVSDAAVATVFCDIGQGNTTFVAKSQTGSSPNYRNDLLGSLMINGVGGDNFYYAFLNTNPPIFIMHRPTNNNFTVNLHSSIPSFNNDIPVIGNYSLILNFETLD